MNSTFSLNPNGIFTIPSQNMTMCYTSTSCEDCASRSSCFGLGKTALQDSKKAVTVVKKERTKVKKERVKVTFTKTRTQQRHGNIIRPPFEVEGSIRYSILAPTAAAIYRKNVCLGEYIDDGIASGDIINVTFDIPKVPPIPSDNATKKSLKLVTGKESDKTKWLVYSLEYCSCTITEGTADWMMQRIPMWYDPQEMFRNQKEGFMKCVVGSVAEKLTFADLEHRLLLVHAVRVLWWRFYKRIDESVNAIGLDISQVSLLHEHIWDAVNHTGRRRFPFDGCSHVHCTNVC